MFQQQNYFPHFPSHTSPPPRSNNILLTDLSVSLEYFSQSFESRRLWCSLFAVQGQPGIFPLKYLNLPPLRLFGVHIFCFSEVCGIRQRRRFCQEFATGVQQAGVRVMENSPEHKQVKFAKFYFVHPVQLVEASEAGGDQDSTFISEHFFCFAFGDIYRKCYRQVKNSRCLDFRGLLRDLCVSGISFMIWEIISDSQFHSPFLTLLPHLTSPPQTNTYSSSLTPLWDNLWVIGEDYYGDKGQEMGALPPIKPTECHLLFSDNLVATKMYFWTKLENIFVKIPQN